MLRSSNLLLLQFLGIPDKHPNVGLLQAGNILHIGSAYKSLTRTFSIFAGTRQKTLMLLLAGLRPARIHLPLLAGLRSGSPANRFYLTDLDLDM